MGRVLVAGSINMDIVAVAKRHPKIGETVVGEDLHYFPGGKGANQAVAGAMLKAEVYMIGKVGSDVFAEQLRKFLLDAGIKLDYLTTADKPSGTAIITVAQADNTIVVVPGANAVLTKENVEAAEILPNDVLVSQFEVPLSAIEAFFRKGKVSGATTILNPAPANAIPKSLLELVDIVVVNETELDYLLRADKMASAGNYAEEVKSLRKSKKQIFVVTLGSGGAIAVNHDEVIEVKGHKVEAIDATGAGDCFVGALAASLSRGKSLREALEFSNLAASISVQRLGAGPSMPDLEEVESA